MLANYGDYVSFDEEGNLSVDFSYVDMDKNDNYKKALESLVNDYNTYFDKKKENLEEEEKIDDEMVEV